MSSYLLDTDFCIYLIRKRSPKALARLQALEMGSVSVSSITLAELEYGVARSTKPMQNKMALAQFLAPLEVQPFDDSAAASYGPVRAVLASQGTPIGPMDTLIASHALALESILVTNNVREYSRVPKLVVENWTD